MVDRIHPIMTALDRDGMALQRRIFTRLRYMGLREVIDDLARSLACRDAEF